MGTTTDTTEPSDPIITPDVFDRIMREAKTPEGEGMLAASIDSMPRDVRIIQVDEHKMPAFLRTIPDRRYYHAPPVLCPMIVRVLYESPEALTAPEVLAALHSRMNSQFHSILPSLESLERFLDALSELGEIEVVTPGVPDDSASLFERIRWVLRVSPWPARDTAHLAKSLHDEFVDEEHGFDEASFQDTLPRIMSLVHVVDGVVRFKDPLEACRCLAAKYHAC